jgi:hypothetical protein
MHTIKTLRIQFDTPIKPYEIPAFRGAIIAKVGFKDTWLFHNHLGKDKYIYRYPLIQYKRIGGKPAILCVGEGVNEIQKLFAQPDWSFRLGKQEVETKVSKFLMDEFTLQLNSESDQVYKIINWVALNQQRYEDYKSLDTLTERIALLEGILTANILAMAKGIGWRITQPIRLHIQAIDRSDFITFKQQRQMAFSLQFKTNVVLPPFLGLGRNTSIGFGTLFNPKS